MYILRNQGAWQELTHYFDDENQYGNEDLDGALHKSTPNKRLSPPDGLR